MLLLNPGRWRWTLLVAAHIRALLVCITIWRLLLISVPRPIVTLLLSPSIVGRLPPILESRRNML
jgi:hypothetical protein